MALPISNDAAPEGLFGCSSFVLFAVAATVLSDGWVAASRHATRQEQQEITASMGKESNSGNPKRFSHLWLQLHLRPLERRRQVSNLQHQRVRAGIVRLTRAFRAP